MKYKTSELDGDALDYCVRIAESGEQPFVSVAEWAAANDYGYSPSANWIEGGPIIEREGIWLTYWNSIWFADIPGVAGDPDRPPKDGEYGAPGYVKGTGSGLTPLVAAMRCFVCSKLSDEVELP